VSFKSRPSAWTRRLEDQPADFAPLPKRGRFKQGCDCFTQPCDTSEYQHLWVCAWFYEAYAHLGTPRYTFPVRSIPVGPYLSKILYAHSDASYPSYAIHPAMFDPSAPSLHFPRQVGPDSPPKHVTPVRQCRRLSCRGPDTPGSWQPVIRQRFIPGVRVYPPTSDPRILSWNRRFNFRGCRRCVGGRHPRNGQFQCAPTCRPPDVRTTPHLYPLAKDHPYHTLKLMLCQ